MLLVETHGEVVGNLSTRTDDDTRRILKFDDVMRVDYVVDDHIEDVELTDEMVETYRVLVLNGMGD